MKLYELKAEIARVEQKLEEWAAEHEGDITDFPMTETLGLLEVSIADKALSIGTWVKNLVAEEKAYKEEIKNLQAKAKTRANKVASLKTYLSQAVPEGQKFENSQCKISWRKSESVQISCDPENLPTEFKKIKFDADKIGLKQALKAGTEIPSVSLTQSMNLQVK